MISIQENVELSKPKSIPLKYMAVIWFSFGMMIALELSQSLQDF
jgi:hypothetical protein